ncbi:MAG TPA: hypothetical protein VMG58_04755 [Candidatus Sulfotelmatobacter sp.]|nr:hypothetical protein [Candidatus Sulfotelmatobacter sp.]
MKPQAHYTPYHPRWYRPPVSVWWWLEKPSYFVFVLRELTSVFVAYVAGLLLWMLWSLRAGPEAYARALARVQAPGFLALDALAFAFVLFHAVMWLLQTPQAMLIRIRGKRLPDPVVAAGGFAACVLVSFGVIWMLLGRR